MKFPTKLLCLFLAVLMFFSSIGISSANEADERLNELKEAVRARYGENKKITDGNYDKSLAVKCVNGTFVGKKTDNIIEYKGIPFVGEQPVGKTDSRSLFRSQRMRAYTRRIISPKAACSRTQTMM